MKQNVYDKSTCIQLFQPVIDSTKNSPVQESPLGECHH